MIKKHYHKMKRWFKKPIHKAIKQDSTPHTIALSFAIGSFIAIFPTFGLGIFIVLFIMIFYKTMNKISAIAGLAFWNFLMMLPIFWLSYNFGRLLLGSNETTMRSGGNELVTLIRTHMFTLSELSDFFKENSAFLKEYMAGNLVLATMFSLISYFVIKEVVIVYRTAKELKKEKLLLRLKKRKK